MWEKYKIPLFIFVVAVLVRVAFFPLIPESGDLISLGVTADGYYEIAEHLMGGEGFRRDGFPPAPDSMRMPLYPFFIVALVTVFGSYYAVFAVQILLGAVNALLSWLITKEFLPSPWAIGVGVATALEPFTAYLTGLLMTETLFMFLFLLTIWFLLRYVTSSNIRFLAFSALLLGAATLVRPATQYFPALILFALACHHGFRLNKQWVKECAVVLGIFFLCIAPWAYRNYVTFGTSELTAQAASNLFFALTSSAIALDTGISYEAARTALFAREGVRIIDDIDLRTAGHFTERALTEIKQHPNGLLKTFGIALVAFFTHDGYAGILDRYGVPLSYEHPGLSSIVGSPRVAFTFLADAMTGAEMFVIFGRIFWICITLLALAGGCIYLIRKGLTIQVIIFAGSIAYFALTSLVLGLAMTGRFRIPVNPFIFMFAAYALLMLYERFRERTESPLLTSGRADAQHLLKE